MLKTVVFNSVERLPNYASGGEHSLVSFFSTSLDGDIEVSYINQLRNLSSQKMETKKNNKKHDQRWLDGICFIRTSLFSVAKSLLSTKTCTVWERSWRIDCSTSAKGCWVLLKEIRWFSKALLASRGDGEICEMVSNWGTTCYNISLKSFKHVPCQYVKKHGLYGLFLHATMRVGWPKKGLGFMPPVAPGVFAVWLILLVPFRTAEIQFCLSWHFLEGPPFWKRSETLRISQTCCIQV